MAIQYNEKDIRKAYKEAVRTSNKLRAAKN